MLFTRGSQNSLCYLLRRVDALHVVYYGDLSLLLGVNHENFNRLSWSLKRQSVKNSTMGDDTHQEDELD